jgi:hypothetical protein
MRGAMRFRAGSIHSRASRANSMDSNARAAASKSSAIQRHTGVSINFQLTNGSGRYFSIGESLANRAIRGIRSTLAEDTSQTLAPERRVTRSSCNSSVLPPTENVSMRSWFVPAGLPSGFPQRAPTSNCTSRSRICCNCRASCVPSLSRRSAGSFRRSMYLQAR